MKKNQVKLVAAGMLVLAFMTGCGSKDNNVNEGLNSIISEDIEDVVHNAE